MSEGLVIYSVSSHWKEDVEDTSQLITSLSAVKLVFDFLIRITLIIWMSSLNIYIIKRFMFLNFHINDKETMDLIRETYRYCQ